MATVNSNPIQGDGEEKRQRLPEVAPAGMEARAAPADASDTAAAAAEGFDGGVIGGGCGGRTGAQPQRTMSKPYGGRMKF